MRRRIARDQALAFDRHPGGNGAIGAGRIDRGGTPMPPEARMRMTKWRSPAATA